MQIGFKWSATKDRLVSLSMANDSVSGPNVGTATEFKQERGEHSITISFHLNVSYRRFFIHEEALKETLTV